MSLLITADVVLLAANQQQRDSLPSKQQTPTPAKMKVRPGTPKIQFRSTDKADPNLATWLSFDLSGLFETTLRVSADCQMACHTHSSGRWPLAHEVRLEVDCTAAADGRLVGQRSAWDRIRMLRGTSPQEIRQLAAKLSQKAVLSSSEDERHVAVPAGSTRCIGVLLKESGGEKWKSFYL